LVITGKVGTEARAQGRLNDILKLGKFRQDVRMLLSPLNEEELTTLLQSQAFEPEDNIISRFRRGWMLGSLLLALASFGVLYHGYQLQPQLPDTVLLEWQQGAPVAIDKPELLSCLLQWGRHQALPVPDHILLEPSELGWSVVWMSADRTYNYQLTDSLPHSCH
jgi:hypothetical protein